MFVWLFHLYVMQQMLINSFETTVIRSAFMLYCMTFSLLLCM